MYFRHLYASTQPTLLQRCDSYDNYCSLLNVILVGNVNMQVGCQCHVPQSLLVLMCSQDVSWWLGLLPYGSVYGDITWHKELEGRGGYEMGA